MGAIERPCPRLKVTIVGNSTVYTVKPSRQSRAVAPYGEQLPRQLAASYDVDVTCHARWFGMVDQAADAYESLVRSGQPDVVIVNYGINECMPRFLPNALTDHLLDWNRRRGVVRDWYRTRVLSWLWPSLRSYQRAAARRGGLRTWRMGPRRFERELRRLIGAIREDLRSLVVVIGIAPPAGDILWLLPHLDRRRDVYQAILEEVVADFPDDVCLVDTAAVIADLGADALPDGIHFNAAAHERVAQLIAGEIRMWADSSAAD